MSAIGRFVWYDLSTTDVAGAEAFYSAVLGWQAVDSGMPGMRYDLFMAEETAIGGVMAIGEDAACSGQKPEWKGNVAVADADATAATAAKAGGSVRYGPDDLPGVGRFALIADPEGATLGVIAETQDASARLRPELPGHGSWHEHLADDPDAAFAFYAGLFGWTKGEGIDMGAMGTYQLYNVGDLSIGGMMKRPSDMPGPAWTYYFAVDAIEPAAARVKAAGGQVMMGPQQVPGGSWIVNCIDPQGAVFALVAPPA